MGHCPSPPSKERPIFEQQRELFIQWVGQVGGLEKNFSFFLDKILQKGYKIGHKMI
jgi:hypothetical protein